MTAFEKTIAELVRQLGVPSEKMRIILTISPDGSYSISSGPKMQRRPKVSAPLRRVDPVTRRIIREYGDPKYGPINRPNYKGPRVGDPPSASASPWLTDAPTPTRDPGGTP